MSSVPSLMTLTEFSMLPGPASFENAVLLDQRFTLVGVGASQPCISIPRDGQAACT